MRDLSKALALAAVVALGLTAACSAPDEPGYDVRYTVTGEGDPSAAISYTEIDGTTPSTTQPLPWSLGGQFELTGRIAVAAATDAGTEMLACIITVDGETVAEEQSRGQVTCETELAEE